MKTGFFSYTIKKRKITLCLVLMIILLGLFGYVASPKQENPDVTAPVAVVTCIYPGASPVDVEKLVTIPIEDALRDLDGYSYSHSSSKKNLSVTVLWLESGSDVDKTWQDMRSKLSDVEKGLPEDCLSIDINTNLADSAGVMVAITSDDGKLGNLENYSKTMEKSLEKVSGVSRVDTLGTKEKRVEVSVDEEKLLYFNISLDDIAKVLSVQNMQIPSGYIEENKNRIMVNVPSGYEALSDIENIIVAVSGETGAPLRIKDLAEVKWGVKSDEIQVESRGRTGLLTTAYFDKNINVLTLKKELNSTIKETADTFPENVKTEIVLFQPDEIGKAVNNFMSNLICGILLVLAVVWLGMSYRNALVISTVIPLSILMTFIAMYIAKIPVHEISTTGLIIALGMLVDNAIVVSDAIQSKLDAGEDKMKACAEGVKESAMPILAATLTTVAAFLPLAMMSGVAGSYIYSVPFTVIVALTASYINAIFVIPVLAYIFFRPSKKNKKDYLSIPRKFFDILLLKGLENKKKTMALAGILICASVFLVVQMGLSFFPYADKDLMHIKINSEGSGNINKTKAAELQVENILKERPEITSYTGTVGGGLPKFYVTMDQTGIDPDYAQIMIRVDLSKSKEKFKNNSLFAEDLQREIDENLIGAKAYVRQLEHAEPAEAPVKVRIHGEKMEELQKAEAEIRAVLKTDSTTFNVRSDLKAKEFEYYVDVDSDIASRLGITNYDIQRQLNIALSGYSASTFIDGNNDKYDVVVKGSVESASELQKLPIASTATGSKAYLEQLGTIRLKSEFPDIERYEGERAITVFSDVLPGASAVAVENNLKKEIAELQLDSESPLNNVSVSFDGEGEKIGKYFGDALKYAFLAVILIYFIMMVQFYSFKEPLIVMITMPLGIVGSVFGLFICRQTLSFTALLGIISLMGIIVNNAILLIDYIHRARSAGMPKIEAIKSSVGRRFRPIMLTTITTVIGLAPLAISGSGLFKPMSIALMSGLIVATMLTLIFIPVVMSALKHD